LCRYASYNLILAGLLTFVCDWLTLVTVVDSMMLLGAPAARDGYGGGDSARVAKARPS
jgi:hypothetical protein